MMFKKIIFLMLFVSASVFASADNLEDVLDTAQDVAKLSEDTKELQDINPTLLNSMQGHENHYTGIKAQDLKAILESQDSDKISLIYIMPLLFMIFFLFMLCVFYYLRYRSQKIISNNILKTFEHESLKMQEVLKKVQNDILVMVDSHKQEVENLKEEIEKTSLEREMQNILLICDHIAYLDMTIYRMEKDDNKFYNRVVTCSKNLKDVLLSMDYKVLNLFGETYSSDMDVKASFLEDDNLEYGSRIITGVTKPTVLYKDKIIQKAEVTVSQNI